MSATLINSSFNSDWAFEWKHYFIEIYYALFWPQVSHCFISDCDPHAKLHVTPTTLTSSLPAFRPCYALKSDSKRVWKIICTYCMTPAVSLQTNRKPWRFWHEISSCHCIPKNLSTVWHVKPCAGLLPHCLLCLPLYISTEMPIPPMLFPLFHLPHAKRADTLKTYSRVDQTQLSSFAHGSQSETYLYRI